MLARNVAAIHSLLQDTLELTGKASIGVSKIAAFNFDDFEKRAWVDEWRGSFFRQLWTLRGELEFQGYKLQQNLRVVKKIAGIITMQGRITVLSPRYSGDGAFQGLSQSDLIRLAEEQYKDDQSSGRA